MRVLTLFPPNYAAINRAFSVRGKPVIFCYGDTIYNPSRIKIPPHLFAHEEVHRQQQMGPITPEGWWQRYIADPEFRLGEEIDAHRAEFSFLVDRGMPEGQACAMVAGRLASPLYGAMLSLGAAKAIVSDPIWPRSCGADATSRSRITG